MSMAADKKKHNRDDQQQAVLFAAAIAALMACVERAVVGVWAFLALNLLLLAIALTSKTIIPMKPDDDDLKKIVVEKEVDLKVGEDVVGKVKEDDGIVEEKEEEEEEISKEELNKRAEDFIAMFRQHLVSDCAKARTFPMPY